MIIKDKQVIELLAEIDRKLNSIIYMLKAEKIRKVSKEVKKDV